MFWRTTTRDADLRSGGSVYEKYCYDSLNRLTNSATASTTPSLCTSTGGSITSKTVAYNAIGNITSKSDVGTYSYPSSGGGTGSRPHAISSITGTVNGVTNPSYTYDSNGNMTAGAGRSVSYTAFNMADTITQGGTTDAFTYDSDHMRIKQCVGSSCATSTTYYLNDPASGAMVEKYVAGGTTTWHDFLIAAGGIVGERFYVVGGSTSWKYFVLDHLGSIAVVTDSAGTVAERLSYDAWGRRRNSNGTDNSACSITSVTSRGYTGHEMLDNVCQVDANARIYDPTIGRFMTPDSFIPHPLYGQSFNRYSYVLNNPLSATDPSGNIDQGCSQGPGGAPCLPVGGDCFGCFDYVGFGVEHYRDTSGGKEAAAGKTGSSGSTNARHDPTSKLNGLSSNNPTSGVARGGIETVTVTGMRDLGPQTNAAAGFIGVRLDMPNVETIVVTAEREADGAGVNRVSAPPNPIYGTTYADVRTGSIGLLDYTYSIYRQGTVRGAVLTLHFNGKTKGLQWKQFYLAKGSGETGTWTLDDAFSPNPPFYNAGGANFLDTPGRPTDSVSWQGQLYLLSPNSAGGYDTMLTISYGFTASGDSVTLMPLTVVGRGR